MNTFQLVLMSILSNFFYSERCDNAKKGIYMVINILKSGEVVEDIAGHEVTEKDVPMFYELLNRISEGTPNEDS